VKGYRITWQRSSMLGLVWMEGLTNFAAKR
jgi:hypothetical protein